MSNRNNNEPTMTTTSTTNSSEQQQQQQYCPARSSSTIEIPHTYAGLYGSSDVLTTPTVNSTLLPFELSRNRNTDWLVTAPPFLLLTYLGIVFVSHLFLTMMCANWEYSWTITNVLHGVITMTYLHWIKGCPNFYEQGEMNAMTLWEQLLSSSGRVNQKLVLKIIPTMLCYAACHFGHYRLGIVMINLTVWGICMIAKMEGMVGVRIWGINSTTGIDDDVRRRKKQH